MRPTRRPADPFAVLGLPPGASRSEVRRAYRRRAKALHPDVAQGGGDTTAAMAELNAARDRLLAATPDVGARGPGDAGAGAARRAGATRSASAPGQDHAPTWDDYWSAWNDLPRRARG